MKWLLNGVSLLVLGCASSGFAADIPVEAPVKAPAPAAWSWTGLYIGAHVGSAMGLNNINDPLGPSIFGDQIHSPGFFGGGQVGFNWQAPGSSWVFGGEAEASLADLDGTSTCFASSGTFTSFNCRAHTDSFGSVTARVGRAFGQFGRTLAYVKGGVALAHSNVAMVVNNDFGLGLVAGNASSTSITSIGWAFGAGTEYALTPHWTVTAEYDYLDLGSKGVMSPSPSFNTIGTLPTRVSVPGTSALQQIHTFELGMNYKFDRGSAPFPSATVWPAISGWDVAVGGRYWYSFGRFQKDIAPAVLGSQNPTLNISRLTWDNLTAQTGEAFGRIDTPWNFFAKGIVGGGKVGGGKVNDEDWGIVGLPFALVPTGYSNTVGNANRNLSYWTIDAGYDFIRGPGMKVGPFVGYNEYRDNESSFTCSEIAFPASGICNPPINEFILGENAKWQSLRLGDNADVMLTDRFNLVADVAFLPYVKFTGQDLHPLRPFVADETGKGIGTQTELFLNYYVTQQFSVGAGGRYWAMWTTSGTDCRLPPNGACPAPLQNIQVKTERYGLLLQAAYKFFP
jgi:opacity protein-like surface antigen